MTFRAFVRRWVPWLLVAAGIASGHLALGRALQNDAFVDEATYVIIGDAVRAWNPMAGAVPAATYLSGAPQLYPALASALFASGDLEAVRLFSTLCMLVAIGAIAWAAYRLFESPWAAAGAGGLFAVQAPVLFLSRFATYDAPSLALVALALAVVVVPRGVGYRQAIVGGAIVGAAAMVKYAALLYIPMVVVVAMLFAPTLRRWRVGAVTVLAVLAAIASLALLGTPMAEWEGFLTTTLRRSIVSGGKPIDLLLFTATLGGVAFLFGLLGAAFLPKERQLVAAALLASALLAPLNHLRIAEFVSLHKHVAFALVPTCVVGGGVLAAVHRWGARSWERGEVVIAVAVVGAMGAIAARAIVQPGYDESVRLFTYWPTNTGQAFGLLAPLAQRGTAFLAEEPDLGALYLHTRTVPSQWVHPYYFDWEGRASRSPSDVEPYLRALRMGHFAGVVLRFGPQKQWAQAMEAELLRLQPRYRLAAELPFELDDGAGMWQVWVRADAAGADAVGMETASPTRRALDADSGRVGPAVVP